MSTKQKNVGSKKWDEKDIEKAFMEVDAGNSMQKTAAQEGPQYCQAAGEQLAKSTGTICSLGFSPTREQIKDLVQEYVHNHELRTPFKDGRPGKDWL